VATGEGAVFAWVGDVVCHPRQPRVPPGHELGCQLPRDGVFVHQPREESLAEQAHQGFAVPALEALEGAVWEEAAISSENVPVWMPLQHVSGRCDRDHGTWADVRPELPPHILGQSFGATLTQIE